TRRDPRRAGKRARPKTARHARPRRRDPPENRSAASPIRSRSACSTESRRRRSRPPPGRPRNGPCCRARHRRRPTDSSSLVPRPRRSQRRRAPGDQPGRIIRHRARGLCARIADRASAGGPCGTACRSSAAGLTYTMRRYRRRDHDWTVTDQILETAVVALAAFFATIGPLDVAAIFAALTPTATRRARRSMAIRGVLIAGVILVSVALVGEPLLDVLGVSLPALRTAGGVLLLLIGIEMVFARSVGGHSPTEEETREAAAKQDISVFPLATPLIAGPG